MNGVKRSPSSSSKAESVYEDTIHLGEPEHHEPDDAVGISAQSYAKGVSKLIQLITDLRAIGAQTHVDLPRIAVIGNQSAGKSSLVEALSGIPVPRASGTCTRCPFECRMQKSSGPWRCQVLLRYETDEYGIRMQDVREEKFGPVLTKKSEVEVMLRRAQLAILNPSVITNRFVDYDLSKKRSGPHLGSTKQLQFSANVVCLDLQSPETTDLSFIDLPGIISNVADDEDRGNIDLIKDLVMEHIQGNALILLTITMRDDIENQSAAFLAKSVDPQGTRTIGVLTKPDTLLQGEHAVWFDVLAGKRHPLMHGYYVTKQPATAELRDDLDYATNRENEKNFFATDSHWQCVSTAIRDRTGVPRLTEELSRLLSQLIEQKLPKLREDTKQQLANVRHELGILPPPPPQHPVAELLRLVSVFDYDVHRAVMGQDGHKKLIQGSHKTYGEFQRHILSTRPNFTAQIKFPGMTSSPPEVIFHEEDRALGVPAAREVIYLDEVKRRIQESLTRELPNNVPYEVKKALILESFEDWPLHMSNCFESIQQQFEEYIYNLVDYHFKRFAHGGLHEFIHIIIEKQFDALNERMKERIKWLKELEDPPYTQNHHYLSSYRERYLTSFREKRQSNLLIEGDQQIRQVLGLLAEIGLPGMKEEDLPKLLEPDEYESELIVMAEVMAYFRVAYKRVIDDVPRIIDLDYFRGFKKDIQSVLIDALELGGDAAMLRAQAYLGEEPKVVLRRKELESSKERLEGIQRRLFRFSTS